MASRKRKFGTIEEPSQDELNDARSSQDSDKGLRLQFDYYTSSDCDSTGQELSIKVVSTRHFIGQGLTNVFLM